MSSKKKQELVKVIVDSTELDPTTGISPELPTVNEDEKNLKLPTSSKKSSSPSGRPYTPQTLKGYEETLVEWRKKSSKMAFIYDYVGDKYRKSLNRASIIAFVITSLISLLALSNLGLSDSSYPTVALILKIVNAVFGVSAAITTGLPRILGWSVTVDACQKYLDTVENLLASIISEQALPVKFRTDPEQYIVENKEKYQAILDSAPRVPHDDYTAALDAYEQEKARLRYDLVQ